MASEVPVGSSRTDKPNDDFQQPYVKILEQPAKVYRFRYLSEGRGGSIPGVNSTDEVNTFPTIQVMNYFGRATVVVSCVTKDVPYRPHPNKLLGAGCNEGVCTLEINNGDMKMVFSNFGIQRVLKPLVKMDMNTVRLCFRVFLNGKVPLNPVISEPISSRNTDISIVKLSHCSAPCTGGQEMILLCENITRDGVMIRFFENPSKPQPEGWEGYGEFQQSEVHHNAAISFRTPLYKSIDITEPVTVQIQLKRQLDGVTSKPRSFQMLPVLRVSVKPVLLNSKAKSDTKSSTSQQQPHFSGNFGCNIFQTQPQTSRFSSKIFEPSESPQFDLTAPMQPTGMTQHATAVTSSIFQADVLWPQPSWLPSTIKPFNAQGPPDKLMEPSKPLLSNNSFEMEEYLKAIEFQPQPGANFHPIEQFQANTQSDVDLGSLQTPELTTKEFIDLCVSLDATNSVEMKDITGLSEILEEAK